MRLTSSFPEGTSWTSLTEVRLSDKDGKSAGNIDVVLVSYDERGRVVEFGALEVQAVYISGNVRRPFEYYMEDPFARQDMVWRGRQYYPRADYLSSSRKRLAPQLMFKGGILNAWGRKIAVAMDKNLFQNAAHFGGNKPRDSRGRLASSLSEKHGWRLVGCMMGPVQ